MPGIQTCRPPALLVVGIFPPTVSHLIRRLEIASFRLPIDEISPSTLDRTTIASILGISPSVLLLIGSSVCSFPTVLKVYKAIAKTPFYLYNNGAENQSNVAIMATVNCKYSLHLEHRKVSLVPDY